MAELCPSPRGSSSEHQLQPGGGGGNVCDTYNQRGVTQFSLVRNRGGTREGGLLEALGCMRRPRDDLVDGSAERALEEVLRLVEHGVEMQQTVVRTGKGGFQEVHSGNDELLEMSAPFVGMKMRCIVVTSTSLPPCIDRQMFSNMMR